MMSYKKYECAKALLVVWYLAVLTATYLLNSTSSPFLNGKSPLHILYPDQVYILHRVFGCTCFVHNKS